MCAAGRAEADDREGHHEPMVAGRLREFLALCGIGRLGKGIAQFLEFVNDGGYSKRELWSDEGWA